MGSAQAGLSSLRKFAEQTEQRAAPEGLMPAYKFSDVDKLVYTGLMPKFKLKLNDYSNK